MYEYFNTQEEIDDYLDINNTTIPKFKFTNSLHLYNNALELHNNYAIFDDISTNKLEILKLTNENNKHTIYDIAIYVPSDESDLLKPTVYYRLNDSKCYISEVCFYISGIKEFYIKKNILIY